MGFSIYEFSYRALDTKESKVDLGVVLQTERSTGETELPRYLIRQQASRFRQLTAVFLEGWIRFGPYIPSGKGPDHQLIWNSRVKHVRTPTVQEICAMGHTLTHTPEGERVMTDILIDKNVKVIQNKTSVTGDRASYTL